MALIDWAVASAGGSMVVSVLLSDACGWISMRLLRLEFYDSQIGLSITSIRKLGVIPQNNPSNPMKSIYLNGAETL